MFRRHKKGNGDWVPDQATVTHQQEDPAVQMRIIRTHVAAQASELGNLAQQLREIRDLVQAIHDGGRHHLTVKGL